MKQFRVLTGEPGNCPMGLTVAKNRVYASVIWAGESCSLVIFRRGEEKPWQTIPMDPRERMGDVWKVVLEYTGTLPRDLEYCFEADGQMMADPCGRAMRGWEDWGEPEHMKRLLRSPVKIDDFDWEDDQRPEIPMEDCVIYRVHTRGFTKHNTSGVRDKGTFSAVARKIPYMKELGVTTVELMPVTEFQEVITQDGQGPFTRTTFTGRLNYWGYADGFYFAPKAAYSAGKLKDPVRELKNLVKELHANGMELVVELFFNGTESSSFVLDVVRYWVKEFHLDGVHLVGNVPAALVGGDPYLSGVKLFANSWDGVDGAGWRKRKYIGIPMKDDGGLTPDGMRPGVKAAVASEKASAETAEKQPPKSLDFHIPGPGSTPAPSRSGLPRRLVEYNDGFEQDMRRFLKGDEGMLRTVMDRIIRNPKDKGVVNYMAHTNGFTLMDMVSYDRKHNEANGENNQDGTDYNLSWNCGEEGPTRKKKIVELRRKQLRNAMLLLFLSQGTPLLESGDEFGHTKGGNNNSYCQDNAVSWLNWSQLRSNKAIYEFAKQAIAFRRAHPVLHMAEQPKLMDHLACGCPDVSFHGVNAWYPEFEHFRRQLGVLYCGSYGKKVDGSPDDTIFVMYNMHWEPCEFAMPNLPKDRQWFAAMDTARKDVNGFWAPGEEPLLEDQKTYPVDARSIVVLVGKTVEAEPKRKRAAKPGAPRRKTAKPESLAKAEKPAEDLSGSITAGSGETA